MPREAKTNSTRTTRKKPTTRGKTTSGGNAKGGGQTAVKTDAPAEPTAEQIAARAYELYLARAGGPGDDRSDWLQAEAELRDAMSRK
jgi:hypothetical protein